jgi:hypothetical protein
MKEFDTSGMGSFFLLLFCFLGGWGHVVMRWYIIESNIHELKFLPPNKLMFSDLRFGMVAVLHSHCFDFAVSK